MQTAAKHTPGPWTINTINPHDIQIRAKLPRDNNFECSPAILGGWDTTAEENAANARLIAAAPELLEALTTLAIKLQRPSEGAILQADIEAANAAIAKARGAQ